MTRQIDMISSTRNPYVNRASREVGGLPLLKEEKLIDRVCSEANRPSFVVSRQRNVLQINALFSALFDGGTACRRRAKFFARPEMESRSMSDSKVLF